MANQFGRPDPRRRAARRAMAPTPADRALLPRDRPLPADRKVYAEIELSDELKQQVVPVKYDGDSPLAGRVFTVPAWKDWSMSQRMAFLRTFVEDKARDPMIAEKANDIVREANVREGNHQGEWAALLKWVQRNVRMTAEPEERIQSPQYTLTQLFGDCLPADTRLLLEGGSRIRIADLVAGQRIWGHAGWTTVLSVWPTGEKRVTTIYLDNGRSFQASESHRVFLGDNAETEETVANLRVGDGLTAGQGAPNQAEGPLTLAITHINREAGSAPCFDLTTADSYVYLPDCGTVVHNCDDKGVLLAALAHSRRLPYRFTLSGREPGGRRIRWIEGEGPAPMASWTHIYVLAQWPPFRPTRRAFAEPTLDVPLGWDSLKDPPPKNRADMGAEEEEKPADGGVVKKQLAILAKTQAIAAKLPWITIAGSVLGTVLSYVVVQGVVAPRLTKKR